MITVTNHTINRSEGIQATIEHSIKRENLGIIFNILRKQLYSDNILAAIREVVCNSIDAHKDSGQANLPVKVTLPTLLTSFFRCRDFGKGLSDEDIQNLYAGYGDSGKRHSNDFIGGMGIGKHAPLAYTDSFIINSYQNGILNSWNSFITPDQVGSIAKMGSAPTTEADGLEIVIPVKNQDIDAFHQKATKLFAYFDVVPEMVNATDADKQTIANIKSMVPVLEGQGYKFFGQRNSKVLMGGIAYGLNSSVFGEDDIDDVARTIIDEGVILYFNIGDLEISASRETLNYSATTKKKLSAILNNIAKDFLDKGNAAFVNCKTLWEAKCLYEKTMKHDGGLYHFRRFLQGRVTWNGQKISDTHFLKTNQTSGTKCNVYTIGYGRKTNERIAYAPDQIIDANPRHIVVENDLNLEKGIISHIIGLLKIPLNSSILGTAAPYDRVYLVTFKDAATKAAWLKDSEFDGPMTLLSSYPKQKLSNYYESNATGAIKNAKHTTREFTLNMNYNQSSSSYRIGRSSRTNIEYFDSCDVDVDNDAGVYILIDAFMGESMNGGYHVSPQSLIVSLSRVKEVCGVAIPTIYAFKKKHRDKVKANKNMVSVWKWIQDHVAAYFTDVKEQTKIANWMAMQAARNECPGLNYFDKLKNFQSDPKSDIAPFLTYVRVLFKEDGQSNSEIENKKNLAEVYGVKVRDFKATVDIKTEYKKVQTKYPLLFALVSHIGFDSNEVRQLIKHLESYVAMVDEKTTVVLPVTASNGVV